MKLDINNTSPNIVCLLSTKPSYSYTKLENIFLGFLCFKLKVILCITKKGLNMRQHNPLKWFQTSFTKDETLRSTMANKVEQVEVSKRAQ